MTESILPPAVQALIDRQDILDCELRNCSGVDRKVASEPSMRSAFAASARSTRNCRRPRWKRRAARA